MYTFPFHDKTTFVKSIVVKRKTYKRLYHRHNSRSANSNSTSSASSSTSESARGSINGPSASGSRPPPRPLSPSSGPPDEAETASDEVKVFDDEDEREESNVNEKYHQVDILSAIKSSLITDTEQVGR